MYLLISLFKRSLYIHVLILQIIFKNTQGTDNFKYGKKILNKIENFGKEWI